MDLYDTAVIGAGMIGSSAARYLPHYTTQPNVLIGPREDQSCEGGVYGAWFDEGRITRVFDFSATWRKLATTSIERYRSIEQQSGIKFFSEVGYLTVVRSDYQNMDKFHETAQILHQDGYKCELMDVHRLKERFPYLQFPSDSLAYFQPDKAGYLNPRSLVKAEQVLARQSGVRIVEDVVLEMARLENDNLVLTMASGQQVVAKNVLVANGAYLNLSNLLKGVVPDGERLELYLTGQTVAYIQISPQDADRLSGMPTIVTSYASGELDGTYILPPIQYPDGNFYIKLGHHDKFEKDLTTKEEVEDWYRSGCGDTQAVHQLAMFIKQLLPDVEQLKVTGGCCVTCKTPNKDAPLLAQVAGGVVVASGGCGYAAKSCDEIGRIATTLIHFQEPTSSTSVI